MNNPSRHNAAVLALLLACSGVCAATNPALAQPGGPPPQGQPPRPGDQPVRTDPEKDDVLVRIRAAIAPTAEQSAALTKRYTQLREEQRAALREVMRGGGGGAGPGPGGPGGGGAGGGGGGQRPSPEQRAKLEAQLKQKIDPLNAAFLADVKAGLTDEQKAKFDTVAKELDLAPPRGPRPGAGENKPFTLKNAFTVQEKDGYRIFTSNGIPDHQPGQFPGRGNPNTISEQKYNLRVTMTPKANDKATPQRGVLAGVALNGVVFDPGTAENWKNDPRSGWRQEAISPTTIAGAKMGLDTSNAHVQPNGAYHYHALPVGLVERLCKDKGVKDGEAMLLVGWSADGFPIYDHHCFSKADDAKSTLKELHASYKLKKGTRPDEKATPPGPGGAYDGTYTQDFEYIAGSGDLDECNGRFGVTPEFPQGTYYYVVTDEFPYISRMFRGTPDPSFAKNDRPPGGAGERRGPGGQGGPGGPGGPDGPGGQSRPGGPG